MRLSIFGRSNACAATRSPPLQSAQSNLGDVDWPARERARPPANSLEVLVDPLDANIDVVAVHGLNPLSRSTHAESTWTAGNKLWLRDFLKHRAPQNRVLLFGYNSNVAFGTTKAGLREQAENLLNRLAAERISNPDRPLLFICHSLGGLVVKRAMVHAKGDETYKKIWASTFGIVFFGTPHRGGNKIGVGSVAAGVARAVLGNPSNGFLKTLRCESEVLDAINDDFRRCLEDFQYISFFETRNFGLSRALVVEPESATLGLAPEREKQLGLDADHRGICKFASEDDPMYQQVESNIVDMINRAVTAGQRRPGGGPDSLGLNVAETTGDCNTTIQVGNANVSKTEGNDNETNQFGEGNKSNTDGTKNVITQISVGPEDALKLAEKFLLRNRS